MIIKVNSKNEYYIYGKRKLYEQIVNRWLSDKI